MGGSVKSNITFGAKYDEEFYDAVLDACALREDLAVLPQGDESEVGEKGLSLSGGQKARMCDLTTHVRAQLMISSDR